MTAVLIGLGLALGVGILGTVVGFDRDRSFYPTLMIVIASLYALFAILAGSRDALIAESIAGGAFIAAAIVGFRRTLWLVVAALAAHGVYDWFHAQLIANPGVPAWYPEFCLAYDVVAAAYLGWLISRSRIRPLDAAPR